MNPQTPAWVRASGIATLHHTPNGCWMVTCKCGNPDNLIIRNGRLAAVRANHLDAHGCVICNPDTRGVQL